MNDTPQPSKEALPSNVEQLRSSSYTLAALDQGFLLGDSMRGVRSLLEYEGRGVPEIVGRPVDHRRFRIGTSSRGWA